MIRVLNVISALNNAGTEAVVMNYYRNMDREKVQFDFLVLNTEKGYYEDEILALGGNIYKIPSFTKQPLKCMRARKAFFKTHHYDIVEVHSPTALRYAYCKLAKKNGCQNVIFHIHSSSNRKGLLIKYARKQLKKYCDQTATCSQFSAISVLGKTADKIVYNAIEYNNYKYNDLLRRKIRMYYNIKNNIKVIGFVGRFSKVKNPIFLLEVLSEIIRLDDTILLMMKGFGELADDIRNKIYDLHLEKKVILCDEQFPTSELYNAFDVLALPSLWEGLPLVGIEAQANGLRTLFSDVITKELNISGFATFVPLNSVQWQQAFLDSRNFERIPETFDFGQTEYNIQTAAQKRQNEYLEMAFEGSKK